MPFLLQEYLDAQDRTKRFIADALGDGLHYLPGLIANEPLLAVVVEDCGDGPVYGHCEIEILPQDRQPRSFFRLEADPHEEAIGLRIVELRAVGDIAAMLREVSGDRGHDAALGRTGYGQDKCCHLAISKSWRQAPDC